MKRFYIQLILSIALIAVGLGLWQLRTSNTLVHAAPPAPPSVAAISQQRASAPATAIISGNPAELTIPSLRMALPVINGTYNTKTKTWTLSLDKVQYAVMTPPPNNSEGNTFIYGHYRSAVFARLHTIQPGAQAVISTDNGHQFTYQLESVRVTSPGDDSLFTYHGPPILTIQTCTGLFFQDRQLFTFKLVKVQ